ncbi:MAG: hypothetical protein M1829_002519 [Trizodia sp. TS-e1964]|nr:MAG: hypothetical protein M1829_002519 [Trizodia sp. TS-e1964]
MAGKVSLRYTLPFLLALLLWFLYPRTTKIEINYKSSHDVPKENRNTRVAIIGAGSGGSSAAYYLRKYALDYDIHTNITVLERSSYVGGRSTTVNVHDDLSEPVELGASIFVEANKNLVSAAKAFGLDMVSASDSGRERQTIGIWNGEVFVVTLEESSSDWWMVVQLLWKYGWAPVRTQNLMKATIGKFLKMYEEPVFPFRSLTRAIYDIGLMAAVTATGEQFLKENQIGPRYSTDIIQASTRVNYGQNLGLLHGVETMVCMATDGAVAIKGGNWKIFDGMIKAAHATLALNTQVTDIIRQSDRRYTIRYTSSNSGEISEETFDSVIVASPLQFSNITLHPTLAKSPPEIPYVNLEVTLFTSPHRLSPLAFNLAPEAEAPQVVLTTLNPADHPGSQEDGVGTPGFFSISTLRTLNNPHTQHPEYLYKIFSPRRMDRSSLNNLLGVKGSHPSEDTDEDITWIYRKTWNSYPYLHPRATFTDPQLDWNLWYTSGIESFISTMETSSLMGMNVARLVVDDWAGIERVGPKLDVDERTGILKDGGGLD